MLLSALKKAVKRTLRVFPSLIPLKYRLKEAWNLSSARLTNKHRAKLRMGGYNY